jgi:hypothetical protein
MRLEGTRWKRDYLTRGGSSHIEEEDRMSSWEQEPIVSPSVDATGGLVSGKKISLPRNVKKTKKIHKSKVPASSPSKMVDNPIWKYLRDIGNIPLLTRKRELEVANLPLPEK